MKVRMSAQMIDDNNILIQLNFSGKGVDSAEMIGSEAKKYQAEVQKIDYEDQMKVTIRTADIKRHGTTILLGQKRTATEGREGNLKTLNIRENGKHIKSFRGSSLGFCNPLTDKDKDYLASLGSNIE